MLFHAIDTRTQTIAAVFVAPSETVANSRARDAFAMFDHVEADALRVELAPPSSVETATVARFGWEWL